MTVAIDIGSRNFAIAVIDIETNYITYCVETVVEDTLPLKAKHIKRLVNDVIGEFPIRTIIIERQVPSNIKAFGLMGIAVGIALEYTDDVVLFDPKQKFSLTNISYTTQNKAHKFLSEQMAYNLLNVYFPFMLGDYESLHKRDDIADAINMAFVELAKRKNIDMDEIAFIMNGEYV